MGPLPMAGLILGGCHGWRRWAYFTWLAAEPKGGSETSHDCLTPWLPGWPTQHRSQSPARVREKAALPERLMPKHNQGIGTWLHSPVAAARTGAEKLTGPTERARIRACDEGCETLTIHKPGLRDNEDIQQVLLSNLWILKGA